MGKLYTIRNWNDHFENNRSRQIERVSWVAIPNRHDGENFSKIMADENASILFASWILLVQIASKCTPRGTLLKGDGTPHTDASLTLKCRCHDAWMTFSLKWFPDNTDWIEVKDVADERQSGVRRASGERQSGDIEGRKEGIERERKEAPAPALDFVVPTWQEWNQQCALYGVPEWMAQKEFDRQEARDFPWKDARPQKHAKRVKEWWDRDGRKKDAPTSGVIGNGIHQNPPSRFPPGQEWKEAL